MQENGYELTRRSPPAHTVVQHKKGLAKTYVHGM